MAENASRLILGTAQFGSSYGIANKFGEVPPSEIERIFSFALESGIAKLDTAWSYGKAESVIGSIGVKNFQIISKVSKLPAQDLDISAWVRSELESSLKRLRVSSIQCLLLHNPADLLSHHGSALAKCLVELRSEGLVEKIGISIYNTDQLQNYTNIMNLDVVQVPYNVFDTRLRDSGWLERLVHDKVDVHVRSSFLQGSLLVNPRLLPVKLKPWRRYFEAFDEWTMKQGASALEACLGFCMAESRINNVVVGVENRTQLEEIVQACDYQIEKLPEFGVKDEILLEPSRW